MPISVTVTVTTKTISAPSLDADPVHAKGWVPPSSFEILNVRHNASKLLPNEKKELAAFCAFAGHPEFQGIVEKISDAKPGGVLKLVILSSAKNEDPPDLILTLDKKNLAIEVTDFPPDQTAMQEAMAAHRRAAPLPLFHESGCSPELVKQFMAAGVSRTTPHFAEMPAEIVALYGYARVTIEKKDASGKSELLLLHGPVAFDRPEADVISFVVANTAFKSLRAVVFVRQNNSRVYWTNLA